MSCCINPYCPQPDDPAHVNQKICRHCGSELLLQGRYQVMRLLSDSSGFGRVYEAYEGTQPKILKVLKVQHNDNPRAVELFYQEGMVLSKLQHPGIPKVEKDGYFQFFPRDSSQPVHCLVMEKIDGPNLTEWMQQQGNNPISEKQALNWLKQLIEILSLVHQNNYFHRDIKPQNIMMRSNGQLVLIDFGAAREMTFTYFANLEATQGITKISSAGYTPPEQEKGHAIPQSDFYALGRTFIYLLTGKNINTQAIYNPLTDQLEWRQYGEHISDNFANLIDKMIASKAIDRPKNTQEILDLIKQIESPKPVQLIKAENEVFLASSKTQPMANVTFIQKTISTARPRKFIFIGILTLLLGLGGYAGFKFYQNSQKYLGSANVSLWKTLPGHSSYINDILISPDGQMLISASADKTIKIWDVNTGQNIRILTGHSSYINKILMSPDGQMLISASADKTIKIWDLNTGQNILTLSGHANFVNALAMGPDGQVLVSGDADGNLKIWNFIQGKEIKSIPAHNNFINAIVISPDGKTLVSASADKTIKIWDLNTGEEIRTLTGHSGYVNDVVISPDGQFLVSGSADKTIKIWDLNTGKEKQTLTGHSNFVNALAINADGQMLVSGSADKTFKFWDLNQNKEIGTIKNYTEAINYFAISPDWHLISTGSGKQEITIWQINHDFPEE